MQEDNKFVSGFVGSLLVHIAILVLFLSLPTPKPPEAPLKFEILDRQELAKTNAQQVIRTPNLPDQNVTETEQDRLRFLAEKTQRVKQQMRAIRSGLTQNRSEQAQTQEQTPVTKPTPPQKALNTDGFEKFLPNKISIPSPRRQARVAEERGFSTLAEDLPTEIQAGEITSVDTDHYLFYSYFSRAQELLWNEWAPMIQSVLNRPPPSLKASNQRRFTTILEAWFLPTGQVHSIHILKPSGVPELDFAASSSFKRVGMIPNPPREKIDADGLIRFKWSLSVEYDPKVLVRQ